ncbi:NERD domain-containing protein [Roseospira marina]|uniref:NERD domain-containing protein n=1 Tax=Roseospira marina TaxID=140057 RepID=A0A5M6IER1_9PROT|nr:nuclease-related domain-containing protein [Roseospira marina]KAA5606763.1 NERD domain-containing protein [Roseospira marina]MBB4313815.1 hypothetical protein [Roseospira marina]MBB5086977.1 hypothetical protein [Roseospira marina]
MDQSLLAWVTDLLWVLLFWVLALFLVTAGVYMTVGPALRQGRAKRRVARAIAQADLPALHDLVLRGRRGGPIQVDHVVRLPTGFVVLETVVRTGRLVGTERSRAWHQSIGWHRHTFGNPLRRLERVMAAVRRALPAPTEATEPVLVTGQVLVPARTRFTRGRPEGVSGLGDFLDHLRAANDANKDQPPVPELDQAWHALAEAGLASAKAGGDPTWTTAPRRVLRHLLADPRTATGVVCAVTGGLMALGLGLGLLP